MSIFPVNESPPSRTNAFQVRTNEGPQKEAALIGDPFDFAQDKRSMSHKEKSELVVPDADGRGGRTKTGARPGNRPGERRSSGKKPSGTNLDRGGGSAAGSAHNQRGRSKAKSKRGR